MGILGLTSYIQSNKDLYLTSTYLQNSKVVIDGNNVFIGMYRGLDKHCGRYGVYYQLFSKSVTEYLQQLLSCKIDPIIVIDGLDTMTKDDLIEYHGGIVIDKKKKLPCIPLLLLNIIIEVVHKMGIILIQSIGQADDTIMMISKMYNCPIISSDGDFYLSGCKYLINHRFIKKRRPQDSRQYILHGQMFAFNKFARSFNNVKKHVLPLALVILGQINGLPILDELIMRPFFTRLNRAFRANVENINHKRIQRTLMWLGHYNQMNQAIADLLACIDRVNRQEVLDTIQKHTLQFSKPSIAALTYLGVERKAITRRIREHHSTFSQFKGNLNGLEIPAILNVNRDNNTAVVEEGCSVGVAKGSGVSFKKAKKNKKYLQFTETDLYETVPHKLIDYHTQGRIRGLCLELKMYQAVLFTPQYEYPEWDNYVRICIPIVETIFSLMNPSSSYNGQKSIMEVYSYLGKEVTKQEICVETSSINVNDIMKLSLGDRRAIINRTLGLQPQECLKGIPGDWKLYLATVLFWMKSNEPFEKDSAYVRAILAAILKSIVKDKMSTAKSITDILPIDDEKAKNNLMYAISVINKKECQAIWPFFHREMRGKVKADDKSEHRTRIFNTFGQLDICLKYSIELNGLLDFPYSDFSISTLVDGILFYNLYNFFKKDEKFVNKRFRAAPSVLNCLRVLENIVVGMIERIH